MGSNFARDENVPNRAWLEQMRLCRGTGPASTWVLGGLHVWETEERRGGRKAD